MVGDKLPERLSSSKGSLWYDARCLSIGVRFNGEEQKHVIEYHVRGGWIRRYKVDAQGKPVKNMIGTAFAIEKVHGTIEPYWRNAT